MTRNDRPQLYGELADWWPLLSSPADYAEEADLFRKAFQEAVDQPRTMLELGSGGGNNASHLKVHFTMTLVDLSPHMIEVSKRLNPELEHIVGDMRTVRLGRLFDTVFLHDAICYCATEKDLRQAMATAFVHCKPGGAALFVPDSLRENFKSSTSQGGHDGPDRALRYLDWTHDPDPLDTVYFSDMVYLLRDQNGSVRVIHDRHRMGLFSRKDWLLFLTETGFQAEPIIFDHSELEQNSYEGFLARKPGVL